MYVLGATASCERQFGGLFVVGKFISRQYIFFLFVPIKVNAEHCPSCSREIHFPTLFKDFREMNLPTTRLSGDSSPDYNLSTMIKTFYRGKLPHIQPIGAVFFVTFHLNGAIPVPVVKKLKSEYDERIALLERQSPPNLEELVYCEQKLFFKKYDAYLDIMDDKIRYLEQPEVARKVLEQVERFEGDWYTTLAFNAMPNHCHWVLDFSKQLEKIPITVAITKENYRQLDSILHRVKGASSRYCNQVLGRSGQFWYHESYDHYVRNDKELANTVNYTINNPEKAGLVNDWRDWEATLIHPDWRAAFM